MLESYLHQESRRIPNLQAEADNLVSSVFSEGDEPTTQTTLPKRPKGPQKTTEIHLTPEEMAKKPQAQARMRAQLRATEQQIKESQAAEGTKIAALSVQRHATTRDLRHVYGTTCSPATGPVAALLWSKSRTCTTRCSNPK